MMRTRLRRLAYDVVTWVMILSPWRVVYDQAGRRHFTRQPRRWS